MRNRSIAGPRFSGSFWRRRPDHPFGPGTRIQAGPVRDSPGGVPESKLSPVGGWPAGPRPARPRLHAGRRDRASRPLKDLRGKAPVVLYFYPMDDTPGCTKEACAFRDDAARYDSLGVRVIGVSTDDPASHRAFAAKHKLPFTLLADTTGTVVQLYGTGVEIEQRGAKRWIANRVTYLIDAGGAIRQVWPRVNPVGHSVEILAAWTKLPPATVKGHD